MVSKKCKCTCKTPKNKKYHPAMRKLYIQCLSGDCQVGWFCVRCGRLEKI